MPAAAGFLRWVRRPHMHLIRIPLAILLLIGSVFSFLPILGLWMLPLGLLRQPRFAAPQVASVGISASFFALFLYLTLYLQSVLGLSAIQTGLVYLPGTVLMFIVSAMTATLAQSISPARLAAGGLGLVAVGMTTRLAAGADSSWTIVLPGVLVCCLGTGLFNPAASWDDIAMLRDRWAGKLMLKGPISPSDARRAVSLGVDGLQLSNHGGRQLDRAIAPVDLIASVREAVGPEVSLVVDSGVRHGSDIAVALALGADACSIGRAYLYGLMAGGELGIDKAIDILTDQFRRTLHLLGMRSAAELRAHGRELLVAP